MDLYIKNNVMKHEYTMHQYVYNLNIVNTPKIISYNETSKTMTMERINNMCISDMYGEEATDVDEPVFDEVRKIIKCLYSNNIEYPDITGYNFIEYDKKMWIIDFEHASISNHITNPFIKEFIGGINIWNPEFK